MADSLLAFKLSQAAELAKRDNAIAALHRIVAQLQRQQMPESVEPAPLGKQGSAERQVLTAEGQLPTAERPQSASSRDASAAPDAGAAGPELRQLPVPATQQSRAQLKGRASLSADRNDGSKGRQQRATGRPAVRLEGQKPVAVRRSAAAADTGTPKQQVRRPLSEVPLGEVSGHAGAVTESDGAVGPAQVKHHVQYLS